MHGGATPRGMDSPHYRHGMRSVEMEALREGFRKRAARIRREVLEGLAEGKARTLAARFTDISARLFLLEVALFGNGHDWYEVSPRPEDGTAAGEMWPYSWHPAAVAFMADLDAARAQHLALAAAGVTVTSWKDDGTPEPLGESETDSSDATS